ncbi:MAG: sigma-70 family RNA polymerase sigma factor [Chitinophagaceae bacterium]
MLTFNLSKDSQQYADKDVVDEILSGNSAMFEILIRRYNPFLYKIGRSYGFSHQDTEDLMQDTFVSSYVNLSQFANRATLKTWLIRIMLNQCYHKANKHSFQKEQPSEMSSDNNAAQMFLKSNHSDTGKSVINSELNKVIEASLEKLSEDYRITFTLRELTGLSVEETAEMMNTTAANVKVRLNRAKMMLRKEIEKTYSPEDIYDFNLIYCDRIVDRVMKEINSVERK